MTESVEKFVATRVRTRPHPWSLLALTLIATPALGMGEMRVHVEKIPKTTMVKGTAAAPLEVQYDLLLGALCDYDVGGDFSEDDPVELQATVRSDLVDRLLADEEIEREAVVDLAKSATRETSACPTGENFVLAILDLPWPLSDAWQVSRFRTSATDAEARIYFDFLGGSAKQSSGYWNLRKLDDGRTELTNFFEFDVGFRIPEFLIKWGVNSALPDFFEDIESFARAWRPRPAPTAATTP